MEYYVNVQSLYIEKGHRTTVKTELTLKVSKRVYAHKDSMEAVPTIFRCIPSHDSLYHLESRWRNSHVFVYHGPLLIHLLRVEPSTFTTV